VLKIIVAQYSKKRCTLLSHLESDSVLGSSGDEVVRNPRRVVVFGDFDGKCIATRVSGAVTDQE